MNAIFDSFCVQPSERKKFLLQKVEREREKGDLLEDFFKFAPALTKKPGQTFYTFLQFSALFFAFYHFPLFLSLFSRSLQKIHSPVFSLKTDASTRYRTGYACEGSQLNISCEEGSQIFVTRANYGRFSISLCNDHGNLDWKVDCSSPTSRSVISER